MKRAIRILLPTLSILLNSWGVFAQTTPGCTDTGACNFNPVADTNDGSCTYPACTDPLACNYNFAAGCDNGTCQYGSHILDCFITQSDSPAIVTLNLYDEEGGNLISTFSHFIFGSGYHQFCYDAECPWLEVIGISGPNGVVECVLVGSGLDPILVTTGADMCIIPGCMDNSACNYNPDAHISDGSCTYPACTDPLACNYNFAAGCDNGTCQYGSHILDCFITQSDSPAIVTLNLYDEEGGNLISTFSHFIFGSGYHQFCYDAECPWLEVIGISGPNGVVECVLVGSGLDPILVTSGADMCIIPGCMDNSACNYNPDAHISDGSCTYPACTDPLACNYNFAAGCDNGTCQYGSHILDCFITQSDSPAIVTLNLYDEEGGNLISTFSHFIFGSGYHQFCYDAECPWLEVIGISGPNGVVECILQGSGQAPILVTSAADMCIIPGCMDNSACNYNPDAHISDGSCTYPACTDPLACNYNFAAGCDNGTCQYGSHILDCFITQSDSPSIVALNLYDQEGGTLISSFSTFIFGGGYHQFCIDEECVWLEVIGISGPNGNIQCVFTNTSLPSVITQNSIELCFNTPCPGDFDSNGSVNISDFLLFITGYGCTNNCAPFDLDESGIVNTVDLLIMISSFGSTCP